MSESESASPVDTTGRNDLPPEQAHALKKAVRWEWATIAYAGLTITLVAFVVGNSQAMKTAWIEDMLSLLPQISFLIALLFVRRRPSKTFPFGKHRAMEIAHLVAGVALLAVGGNLAVQAALGLIVGEHPTIGTIRIFGRTIWLGWAMIVVMVIVVIGPLIYGPAKKKLAPVLHNKLLAADGDMAKADWQTNAASIVGVLGVGVGLWWLDGVAAIFIAIGIVVDGVRNTRYAVRDLLDERARTYDDTEPHPLIYEILEEVHKNRWVGEAGLRMRDEGHVFHVEVFFVPTRPWLPLNKTLEDATRRLTELDWKIQDIVLVPVTRVPDEATSLADQGSS